MNPIAHGKAATTAVIVVDMQNDTVHAKGAFAETGAAAHAESQGVIAHIGSILDAAREAGVPVIHNRIVVYPNPVLGGDNAPIFRMLGPDSFAVDSWGAAIVDELAPKAGEPVLDRIRMSAFHGTPLDSMLRNLGVTDLVVVGAWTNMAVEHTVRDAADYGYAVSIVSDATSSLSAEWQDAALGFALTNIATITDTESVVGAMRA
jgi:nicotinamidase-related amidase